MVPHSSWPGLKIFVGEQVTLQPALRARRRQRPARQPLASARVTDERLYRQHHAAFERLVGHRLQGHADDGQGQAAQVLVPGASGLNTSTLARTGKWGSARSTRPNG